MDISDKHVGLNSLAFVGEVERGFRLSGNGLSCGLADGMSEHMAVFGGIRLKLIG